MQLPVIARYIVGGVIQSWALSAVGYGDVNIAFSTRSVGHVLLSMFLLFGTIVAAAPPFRLLALLIPVVRADLMFLMLARLVRSLIWARHISSPKLLYINEVFPLQAAAMIWNDCRSVLPHTSTKDERTFFVDWLSIHCDVWRSTAFDGILARMVKFPFYLFLSFLAVVATTTERIAFFFWRVFFLRGGHNRIPVPVEGERYKVLGHTMLISDAHLAWAERATSRLGDSEQTREARDVALQSLHVATLLSSGGYSRLHGHGKGGHAMSEYYAAVAESPLVKGLLSRVDALRIFSGLQNGNQTTRGKPLPRQVLWARIVVGALQGLRGRGRWRGPVAIAMFRVALDNVQTFGRGVARTAMQRHVYSVMRRWLVDWMMHVWWVVDIEDDAVNDADAFFERLGSVLLGNIVHNTVSLPHAVGELSVSVQREPDVDTMLATMLGADWELWMQQSNTPAGVPLFAAMAASDEWKCGGRQLTVEDSVDSTLYVEMPLEEAIQATAEDGQGRQVRAILVDRISKTLISRVRQAWYELPDHLMNTPDAQQAADEY